MVEISDVSVECHLVLPLCFSDILWLDVRYGQKVNKDTIINFVKYLMFLWCVVRQSDVSHWGSCSPLRRV